MVDKRELEKAIHNYTCQSMSADELRKLSQRISSQIELMVYEMIRNEVKQIQAP